MGHASVRHHYAPLSAVRMHYVEAGAPDGVPVVLLHGWPETWYAWRKIIPLITEYRIIAPDLRGLGDSSRPADGYDKQTVAGDILELLTQHLGVRHFFVVGHDVGGLVAYAVATSGHEAVRGLAVLDVTIPSDGVQGLSQDGKRWHHAFHRTLDLPEELIRGREKAYLSWFLRNFAHRADAITDADIEEYLRTYTQPGALRASLAYYRTFPQDSLRIKENLLHSRLDAPVLALGGTEAWGRGEEPLQSLRELAQEVTGGAVPDCGHFIPEEQPEVLARILDDFFVKSSQRSP